MRETSGLFFVTAFMMCGVRAVRSETYRLSTMIRAQSHQLDIEIVDMFFEEFLHRVADNVPILPIRFDRSEPFA